MLILVRLPDLACLKLGIGLMRDASLVLSAREEAPIASCGDRLPNWRSLSKTLSFSLANTHKGV